MSVFVISDLHLSLHASTNKSMEVFGNRWKNYITKLEASWRAVVNEGDTVVLPGDISWGLTAEEALEDLTFLDTLPGHKIIGKGNHDFWWQTMRKMTAFCQENKLDTLSFLFNNAYEAEGVILCGSRGWFYDPDCDNIPKDTDFAKISAREANRLQMSIDEGKKLQENAKDKPLYVFMHFPVVFADKVSEDILAVMKANGIRKCYYGHIHGTYDVPSSFFYEGIEFILVSADFLNFVPKIVCKQEKM